MVIATSSLGVAGALREIGSPIVDTTFFSWRLKHPELDQMYARAKEEQTEYLANEMLEIADTPTTGVTITTKPDGSREEREGDMFQHRRLQIDTRKWIMAKLKPRKYGEKIDVTTNGESVNGAPDASKEARALELMKIVEHVEQRALSERAKSLLE